MTSKKKITDQQLKDAYKAGRSTREICDLFGVSRQAIYQRFRKLGLTPNSPHGVRYRLDSGTVTMVNEMALQKGNTRSQIIAQAIENLYLDETLI